MSIFTDSCEIAKKAVTLYRTSAVEYLLAGLLHMDGIRKLGVTRKLFCLCFVFLPVLTSCTATKIQRPPTMINRNFTLDRLELVDAEGELTVTDEEALDQIAEILERSTQVDTTPETMVLSKTLRLICSNPNDSRIYVVDVKNGYATILSKKVMPVFRIHDIDRFNEILQTSGTRNPNAS